MKSLFREGEIGVGVGDSMMGLEQMATHGIWGMYHEWAERALYSDIHRIILTAVARVRVKLPLSSSDCFTQYTT